MLGLLLLETNLHTFLLTPNLPTQRYSYKQWLFCCGDYTSNDLSFEFPLELTHSQKHYTQTGAALHCLRTNTQHGHSFCK